MPRASRYNAGTLYPILHKLESRGLVVSYKEKLDSGRERKYYQITKAGIAQLEQYQIRFTDVVCFRISDDNSIYVKGDYDIYIFYERTGEGGEEAITCLTPAFFRDDQGRTLAWNAPWLEIRFLRAEGFLPSGPDEKARSQCAGVHCRR